MVAILLLCTNSIACYVMTKIQMPMLVSVIGVLIIGFREVIYRVIGGYLIPAFPLYFLAVPPQDKLLLYTYPLI